MDVRVLAFARVREILGTNESIHSLATAATIADLWERLETSAPALCSFRTSIRFARNGNIVPAQTALCDGDEVALLPPVSGG